MAIENICHFRWKSSSLSSTLRDGSRLDQGVCAHIRISQERWSQHEVSERSGENTGWHENARYHWKVTRLLFHKDSIFFLILKFCIWKHSMTESIYIHLQCFWYDTVFNTSTVFCKRFCFVRQKQTPLDKKIQLRHNFVVIFLLNEKTEKVQKWAGSAIVSENHILLWGKAFEWLKFDYWSISDSSISLKILL